MTRSHRLALPLLLLLACALPRTGLAAWPNDPLVNVPLCTASGNQSALESCSDGAGGAIVVWVDSRSGTADIYVRRISREGLPLWTAQGVALCTATGIQYEPAICEDGAGGAIVGWLDYRSGSRYDVYAQRVNASGVPQWTANGVILCSSAEDKAYVSLCTDGSGGAIVAWSDLRNTTDYNLYARRISSSGTAQWTANGVLLCNAASNQMVPSVVADATGGAIVTWIDYRTTGGDVHAQRVNASGAAQWTANGVALCDNPEAQTTVCAAPDGAGGVVAAWNDYRNGVDGIDMYAQRIGPSGTILWAADGVAVSATTEYQFNPDIVADGTGGAIVTWEDRRTGSETNIYAQKISPAGHPMWTANGVALCTATGNQNQPAIASDGTGGAIVAWMDERTPGNFVYARRVSATGTPQWGSNGIPVCTIGNSTSDTRIVEGENGSAIILFASTHEAGVTEYNIFAQRVDRFGALGEAEPVIASVKDVRADQGGQVAVEWTASYLDAEPAFAIDNYSVWRQVPTAAALARSARAERDGGRAPRTMVEGAQTVYWEWVGSQPARGRTGYSFVVPTTTDSMAGSNLLTSFMVSAEESGGTPYWDSAPVSGYSVDNLAPPAPAPFTGTYADGAAILSWGACPASDFAAFQLYRGTSADFVPGAGNLVTSTTGGGFTDATPTLYYKLCAVDEHGNASPYAALYLAGVVDVAGAALPREVFLAAPAPNPARAGALLRFGLPRAGRVALDVHDAQGRRVRMLEAGTLPAGEHVERWDGADDAGRALPAGLYLVRLEVGGRVFTRRLAVLR